MKFKTDFFNSIIIFILSLIIIGPVYGIGKVHFPKPKELTPIKITNQPGRLKIYSKNNTKGWGLLGPDSAATNTYLIPTEEAANENETIITGIPYADTVNGESAIIIPFTWGPISAGGSSVAINGSTITNPNFINGSEINITNNAGSISSSLNNGSISLAKLSTAAVLNTSEMTTEIVTDLDDSTVMTSGAVYSLIAQILGLPDIVIVSPVNNSWVNNSTTITGTASDSNTINSIEWKLETSGTYATTGVSGTTNWNISGINFGADGAKNLYTIVTDNEGNTRETHITVNSDNTVPVGVANVDSTHNGKDVVVAGITVTEANLNTVTFVASGATPTSGSCTLSAGKYVTPNLTPSGVTDITVTFTITDLAGNTAVGTDLVQSFIYSGGATYTTIFTDNFNRSYNTDVITGSGWTSETDTANLLSIVANQLYVQCGSNTTAGAIVKSTYSFTTTTEVRFTVNFPSITTTNGTIVRLFGNNTMYFHVSAISTTALNRIIVGYKLDTTAYGTTYVNSYPFAANKDYNIVMRYTKSTGTNTNDGICYVSINGTELINVTTIDNDSISTTSNNNLGKPYSENNPYLNYYIDNFWLGVK